MTEEHKKEQLSKAYAYAIAANAGVIFRDYNEQDYGLDGKFADVEYDAYRKRYIENGYGIEFQLKATTNIITKNGYICYDLEVKNYCDLIRTDVGFPRILIVYLLPKEKEDWLRIRPDYTVLKKCAWWCSLKGHPNTDNRSKIRVEIPINQYLTCDELKKLIKNIKEGVDI